MTGNRLKLNNEKTEAFLGGSRRMLRVSEDKHLRVGDRDISFKFHVKNVGVYFDATLSVVKHVDHISRSAYLEIRRISSIRHLLTTKAAAQLMFWVVFSPPSIGWTTATLCLLTSTVMRCTSCRKFKTMQQKLAFARADINKLNHWSKHFTCCQSKEAQFSS